MDKYICSAYTNILNLFFILQFLLDNRHPDPSSVFHEGQSLVAKVTEVNEEKHRFLVSVRLADCFHGDSEVGVNLLSSYLKEYRDAIERLKSVEGLLMNFLGCWLCICIENCLSMINWQFVLFWLNCIYHLNNIMLGYVG